MKKIKQFVLNLLRADRTPVQYDTELTRTYSDYGRGQR